LLCAENTKSVCRQFFGKQARVIALGIASYTNIDPFEIPLLGEDDAPIFFGGFNGQIYVHKAVARLPKGIPNPKAQKPPELGGSGLPSTPGNVAGQRANLPAGQRPPSAPKPAIMKEDGAEEPQTLQVLDKEQFMRLLADKGVLPEYLLSDERVSIDDSDIHISKEGHPADFTRIVYKNGVLEEMRLPPFTINTPKPQAPVAERLNSDPAKPDGDKTIVSKSRIGKLKVVDIIEDNGNNLKPVDGQVKRNIIGNPIPDAEAERGASVTNTTIRNEIERWQKHPVLSKYAPTEEELKKLLRAKQIEIVVKGAADG